jgi:hypothetical protein
LERCLTNLEATPLEKAKQSANVLNTRQKKLSYSISRNLVACAINPKI